MPDLGGDLDEGVLNSLSGLGARFDMPEDAVLGAPALGFLGGHRSFRGVTLHEIELIAHQHDDNIRPGDLAEVGEPVTNVLEGGGSGDVVDKKGAASAAEIGPCYGFVDLLSGGVPEGKLHVFLHWRGRDDVRGPLGGILGGRLRRRSAGLGEELVRGTRREWLRGGADGNGPRSELDADGDIVRGGEASFAKAYGELVIAYISVI